MLLPRLLPPSTRLLVKRLGRRYFHSTLPRNKHPQCHGNVFPPVDCFLGSDTNQFIDPRCKVAIVIEGGSQLGYAVANSLLCNYAQTVVLTSAVCSTGAQAMDRLIAEHGSDKAHLIQADPKCMAHLEAVFKETYELFGRVDIVFNSPREITNPDSWEHDMDLNLNNIFRGTVLALKFMGQGGEKTKGGVIINSATTAGLQPVASMPAHTAAQHGVVGATRCFGDQMSYQKTGVRVVGLLAELFVPGAKEEHKCPKPDPNVHPEAISVGMASIHLVKRAPSGSIWVVKDGQLHIANIPTPSSYSKLVKKYV